MAFLVVVALVTTVLNLLLLLGVIRRLREIDARLAPVPAGSAGPPTGSTVDPLTATTVAGRAVSTVDRVRATLLGFFSPGCAPCADSIPAFVDLAAGFTTVAVIVGDDASYAARLAAVDVVVEPDGGPWATALQVTSFPTFCLVDRDGVVLGSGNGISDLPTLTAV
jgi:hypothetical protein